MKKTIMVSVFLFSLLFFSTPSVVKAEFFGKKKVKISTSEPDAEITVNGVLVGNGQAVALVPSKSCVYVKIKKIGFLTMERTYCNKKNFAKPPKQDFFKMDEDKAFVSSVSTDIANVDINVKTDRNEKDAWRLVSQITTSYFDVIEVTDSQTVYLRTAWSAQNFNSGVVRNRIIIKLGSTSPLTYKIKLVSEISDKPNASIKNDQLFKPWDRVLRKYDGLMAEFQSRLSK